MKFRSMYLTALCGLAVSAAFTSCSDDDEYDPFEYGSKVALPEHRGYILNEGSYKQNNASIAFFDSDRDTTTTKSIDLYYMQNGKQLGDTGQDIIEYDGNVYVVMYGSNYVAKLNKAGIEEKRVTFDETHGQPRYAAADNGYLYVTAIGGYVCRFDAKTLEKKGEVEVGKAPEHIVIEDNKIYVALGNAYDNTNTNNKVAIIDTNNFNTTGVKKVDVMDNTQVVVECGDYIMVQGYGADWTYTPLYALNTKTGKAQDTGEYTTHIVEQDNKALCVWSMTDWSTYETTNTYYVYDPVAMTKTDVTATITAAAPELKSATIYGMSEGKDDSFYILTSQYSAGPGSVYHFSKNYTLLSKMTTWGQNPRKVILVD